MMSRKIKISLVCCGPEPSKHSQMVQTMLEESELANLVLETSGQVLAAGEEKGLHNAVAHETHGLVTYLQEVTEGGFSVFTGDPENLREHWIGAGSWVGFIDDEGPGHSSKAGPDGCKRTFRILRGQIKQDG